MLKKVKIRSVKPLGKPQFITAQLAECTRENETFLWETIVTHDSVHILVNNVTTKELLYVNQVRVPVLARNPKTSGEVVECCAGIVDKYHDQKNTEYRIAQDEVREELGYEMPIDSLVRVRELKGAVGTAGSSCTAFYAEVHEAHFVGQQLGPDEDIEIIRVPYEDVEEFIAQAVTDGTTSFLTEWWLRKHYKG